MQELEFLVRERATKRVQDRVLKHANKIAEAIKESTPDRDLRDGVIQLAIYISVNGHRNLPWRNLPGIADAIDAEVTRVSKSMLDSLDSDDG